MKVENWTKERTLTHYCDILVTRLMARNQKSILLNLVRVSMNKRNRIEKVVERNSSTRKWKAGTVSHNLQGSAVHSWDWQRCVACKISNHKSEKLSMNERWKSDDLHCRPGHAAVKHTNNSVPKHTYHHQAAGRLQEGACTGAPTGRQLACPWPEPAESACTDRTCPQSQHTWNQTLK